MAHNALKWALWEVYPEADHLEDIWQFLAGLEKSSNLLHSYLGQWLALHIDFVDRGHLPLPSAARPLWASLG
eukprot:31552-Lingulodinium_polyedra.AAC.1